MSTERHIFASTVLQVETGHSAPSLDFPRVHPIRLRLFKQTRVWYDDPADFTTDGEPTFVTEKGLLLGSCSSPTSIVREYLSSMGVPQQEHKVISSKIFARILFNVANNLPITVNILDITVVLLGAAQYHDVIDRVAIETILFEDEYRNRVNFIPASRSSIKSLKKTRLDSLEESVIRLIPSCAICLEDFAECTDQMVTTLPCKHQYHEGCIVQSLEISHLCPLCRNPMPILEMD